MSVTKSIIAFGYPPILHMKASHRSQTRISSISSANFGTVVKHQNLSYGKQGFKYLANIKRLQKHDKRRRSFVVYSVVDQPGSSPPSEPPFNFVNWIVGVILAIVLPFSRKCGSLLKFKNEVDTAVATIEVIVDAVEKVAEGVEKAAEHIADDLPEGGRLRKAVDFVENVAERASKEAHLVGDFIDKVQEAEEKVEACVESLAEEVVVHHEHPKEEDRAHEQPKETNNEENKNY